jgi:uncharacterized protein (DUF58 family)
VPILSAHRADDGQVSLSLERLVVLHEEARGIDLRPRDKLLATRSGGHLSRFRGRGMEFDESRVYQPGDEPRNMDWRVTARTGQAHVKLFHEERERPVWLIVDQGESMRFGTRVAFKSVIAAHAAALLAWAAADKGDRVGGLVYDERHARRCPVAAGKRGVLPLLGALAGRQRGAVGSGHASIDEAVGRLAPSIPSGALVVIASDFRGIGVTGQGWLTPLARRCELLMLHVYDPIEVEPPPPGRYAVTDGTRRRVLDTASARLRHDWHDRFVAHRECLESLALQHHAHLLGLRTDEAPAAALRRGLGLPRGRPGGRR